MVSQSRDVIDGLRAYLGCKIGSDGGVLLESSALVGEVALEETVKTVG